MSDNLSFIDFNFKLLVIEELMYSQRELEPFSLVEWAEQHDVDLEEHLGEVVPGALEYFQKLQIPVELAENIEELVQDGGNEVYANIAFQWDGEDDTFDLATVADAAQFPNLARITLLSPEDVDGVEDLRAEGVEVDEL